MQGKAFLKKLFLAGLMVVPTIALAANVDVWTQRNDSSRSSVNLSETTLTPSNVNTSTFGKLQTLAADDQVYVTPLYVANVNIGGVSKNMTYFASVNNTVYGYNVDTGGLNWSKNLNNGFRPFNHSDANAFGACGGNYQDARGNMGVMGTPVIDTTTNTLYVIAKTVENGNFVIKLHALDITNGNEKMGGPKTITANGFDTKLHNQHTALLLMNNSGGGKTVYAAWASYCDFGSYHGWAMGYDAATLAQRGVWNATPGGSWGGIWQGGAGMAANGTDIIIATGNGSVGSNQYGESVVKLGTNSTGGFSGVNGFWTPSNWNSLNGGDTDQGASGVLLLPGNRVLQGGKDGILHLLNLNNLGGVGGSQIQQFQSTFSQNGGGSRHIHGAPVYWHSNANNDLIYIWGENDFLRTYKYSSSSNINTTPFHTGDKVAPSVGTGMPGAMLSVSANGGSNGIVWSYAVYDGDALHDIRPGALRAYNADNATTNIWSNRTLAGDDCGMLAKSTYPVISNGKVLIASFGTQTSTAGKGQVCVYGLK